MDKSVRRGVIIAGLLVVALIPQHGISKPFVTEQSGAKESFQQKQMGEDRKAEKTNMAEKMGKEMAHGFPHPFFNHMGIPDMEGMVSARITGYRQGATGEESTGDYGFHLEAGIREHLGLHIRNNEIKQNPRTDVMLMYSVLQDAEGESGVSLFGGALIPSGTIPPNQDEVIGAFGISGRKVFGDSAIFDGNVHYMPEMEMIEIGLSLIYKASTSLFPVFEVERKLGKDKTVAYLLPALKFKLKPGIFLGAGSQFPLTSDKEFDARALLQLDMAW